MIESIEFIPKKCQRNRTFPKKINKIDRFPKNVQRNRWFSPKSQHIYWVDWLIWLNHSSHSIDLSRFICTYVLSNMIDWYIQVIPIHGDWINSVSHFATIELMDMAWVVYKSTHDSGCSLASRFSVRHAVKHNNVRHNRNINKIRVWTARRSNLTIDSPIIDWLLIIDRLPVSWMPKAFSVWLTISAMVWFLRYRAVYCHVLSSSVLVIRVGKPVLPRSEWVRRHNEWLFISGDTSPIR